MGKAKLFLTPADEGLELSHEEYAEADCKPPWRYERAKGRLVVMVPPGHDHHMAAGSFRNYLGAYLLAHPEIVEFVFQESWAAVDEETERHPDIAVYLVGSSGTIPERVPDLIYEIVSRDARGRKRDYVEKRDEYRRLGVREYVIVDRFEHTVSVLRLRGARYRETLLGPDDAYSTPLLPGLTIPLEGII